MPNFTIPFSLVEPRVRIARFCAAYPAIRAELAELKEKIGGKTGYDNENDYFDYLVSEMFGFSVVRKDVDAEFPERHSDLPLSKIVPEAIKKECGALYVAVVAATESEERNPFMEIRKAVFLESGIGVEADPKEAFKMLNKTKNTVDIYSLAIARSQADFNLEACYRNSIKGKAGIEFELGKYYYGASDKGEKDTALGVVFMARAVKSGSDEAAALLSHRGWLGYDVKVDSGHSDARAGDQIVEVIEGMVSNPATLGRLRAKGSTIVSDLVDRSMSRVNLADLMTIYQRLSKPDALIDFSSSETGKAVLDNIALELEGLLGITRIKDGRLKEKEGFELAAGSSETLRMTMSLKGLRKSLRKITGEGLESNEAVAATVGRIFEESGNTAALGEIGVNGENFEVNLKAPTVAHDRPASRVMAGAGASPLASPATHVRG